MYPVYSILYTANLGAVVKNDLTLWCEVFKDIARTPSLGHAYYTKIFFSCKF